MLSQLPKLAQFLAGNEEGYRSIIEKLVPTLKNLLTDLDKKVVIYSTDSLANVTEIRRAAVRREYILTIVLGKSF